MYMYTYIYIYTYIYLSIYIYIYIYDVYMMYDKCCIIASWRSRFSEKGPASAAESSPGWSSEIAGSVGGWLSPTPKR